MNEQERAFHTAMVDVYQRAKKEAGYNATRFLQMLSELGGLETARHLLHSDAVSDGFTALWQKGRLDITVEAVVAGVLRALHQRGATHRRGSVDPVRIQAVGRAQS